MYPLFIWSFVLVLAFPLWSFGQTLGKFEAQTLDSTLEIGYGLAVGDVDGDGKPDILLADKKEFVWYRNGDWKRFVMIRNLTERDNVCIAAKDINGDGQVEVAVGAQWNPGETQNHQASGSVHYLVRPSDPREEWRAIKLPHVPTIHRMRWAQTSDKAYQLIVLPLHGEGNKVGRGKGVKVLAFPVPEDLASNWEFQVLDSAMHLTHNFEVENLRAADKLYVGGKEGIQAISHSAENWSKGRHYLKDHSFGEIRLGLGPDNNKFFAGVEPMHGNLLSVNWLMGAGFIRQVLCDDLVQGHALATGDLLGQGQDQIVVGWRNPNENGKVGIRMYYLQADGSWGMKWIDENTMACEDLKLADLDEDGKLDVIACGRATKNLKIYWNKFP